MIFWIDAQLPPEIAPWLRETFKVEAYALRGLGLRDAEDIQIYQAAKQAGATLISKDNDFVELVLRLGTPPQLLWVTCGNVTNARLKAVFAKIFPEAQTLLAEGRPVIEVADEN
jgi:predicted nuclease of predicted toxin-antitoxin system